MKSIITITVFLLVSLPALTFQDSGPKLTFEIQTTNLGVLRKGDIKTVEFKFSNTGDQVLEIGNIQADCGCTTPTLEKRTYKPGEEGVLPVTLNTLNLSGEIHKNVYVYSNDRDGEKIQLHLDGEILTPVTITPEAASMSRVPRAGLQEGTYRVSTKIMDKLEISNPRANLPFINLEAKRVDDQNFDLSFSFQGEDVPQDANRLSAVVTFDTNSPDQPQASTRLIIRMLDVVSFKPRLVTFLGNDTEPKTLTLMAANPKMELAIEKVETDQPYIKAEQVEGEPLQVKVSLTDEAPEGSFAAKITITTNAEEQPQVIVPVRVRR